MTLAHPTRNLTTRSPRWAPGLGLLVLALVSSSSEAPAQSIQVPNGFCAEVVLDGDTLTSVRGLAVAADGTLYVSEDGGLARVIALDPTTDLVTTVIQGAPLFFMGNVLIGDGSPGLGDDLVLADYNTALTGPCCDGAVLRIDRQTGAYTVLATGNPTFGPPGDPYGLALGPGGLFGTDVFVTDFQGNSPNPPVLFKVSPGGGASSFLVDPVQWDQGRSPSSMAFDPGGDFGGDLFVLDGSQLGGAPAIWRVTPQAGLSVFAQGTLELPGGIDFASGGAFGTEMYVLDVKSLASSTVYTLDPSGSLTPFATGLASHPTNSFLAPSALAFAPDGQTLYVALVDTVYRIRPASPWTTYCTAGTSAAGCSATLSACGTASATAATGFNLIASQVEGNKDGIYFLGTNGRQANPWGNGTSYQCVVPPVKRANLLDGSGTTGACDGSFSQDLNVLWTAKPAQNPGAGTLVQAQLWYRDPQSTSNQTTSLSDAIEFTVAP